MTDIKDVFRGIIPKWHEVLLFVLSLIALGVMVGALL
jgi:hypothetical protein